MSKQSDYRKIGDDSWMTTGGRGRWEIKYIRAPTSDG